MQTNDSVPEARSEGRCEHKIKQTTTTTRSKQKPSASDRIPPDSAKNYSREQG
jgi:hypothetical protein